MNNDNLIEIYEIKRDKLLREISDLWEVGKKSRAKQNKLAEIDLILRGLEADQIIDKLKKENRDLRLRLINELGVDPNELYW